MLRNNSFAGLLDLIKRGKNSSRRSRSRLPRWLRFHSLGSLPDQADDMAEKQQESRSDRVARYKEERRRQLAAQFGVQRPDARGKDNAAATSSSSEGPRPTRASKLRAAAALTSSSHEGRASKSTNVEVSIFFKKDSPTPMKHSDQLAIQPTFHESVQKSPASQVNGTETRIGTTTVGSRCVERDKSSKRKSNLNRSLTSEEVPPTEFGGNQQYTLGVLYFRIYKPNFPGFFQTTRRTADAGAASSLPEVLDESKTPNSEMTLSQTSQPSTSPMAASSPTSRATPKKSDLRVHMENARRGATPAYSEMGRYKPFAKRNVSTSSPKEKASPLPSPSSPRVLNPTPPMDFNQVNSGTKRRELLKVSSVSDNDDNRSKNIAKRMEELTAFTRQTLARVERLANKTKESPKKEPRSSPSSRSNRRSPLLEKSVPSSILKKKSLDESKEPAVPVPILSAGPVSILKRKVSQNDALVEHSATPPVTFSPSVVEPSSTKRKQGILKKRRSLDESTVMRHRNCSPDVAANQSDSRSILKNQRRSSLEELTRTQSPEIQLQGILKRKTSRNEDDDQSLNSPQSILKRRSGASSAGSTSSTPHVSITTAVILAAAGGAEIILEPESEPVKPILKKKSFSEEHSLYSEASETPKPILKKKSSTETDDSEEKPRPTSILKLPKAEALDTGQESRRGSFKHTETESDVRPILKQKQESPRPRLSFSKDEETVRRKQPSRRSHTICTDFNLSSLHADTKEEDRLLRKPRPLSVHELVMSFEKSSTGAIPKRSSLKRNNDRYRTQPVTSNELEASTGFTISVSSLNLVKTPNLTEDHNTSRSFDIRSLLDFTSSLENDSRLNSTSFSPTSPEGSGYGKMSSDSAFQSLGDGLELEQDDESATQDDVRDSVKVKGKLEPTKLELQMKAIAEEAKKMRLGKGNAGIERYRTRRTGATERLPARFSTQPVTFEEVQEAARINQTDEQSEGDDPSKLSLRERIKMFDVRIRNKNVVELRAGVRSNARFSLDSGTAARPIFANATFALGVSDTERSPERKSILKAGARRDAASPKSVLKKRDDVSPTSRRSILKTEPSPDKDDEGISCNDSDDTDSDTSPHKENEPGLGAKEKSGLNGDSTSEGESSGGREIRSIFKNDGRLRV
ncbi:hypothetical protein NQ315_001188, partial [Exocentrus adspersus]